MSDVISMLSTGAVGRIFLLCKGVHLRGLSKVDNTQTLLGVSKDKVNY